jgi:hypothetical protein
MKDFFDKAEQTIPNLAGVKFQSTHLMEASQVQGMHNGQFQVMVGLDEVRDTDRLQEIVIHSNASASSSARISKGQGAVLAKKGQFASYKEKLEKRA